MRAQILVDTYRQFTHAARPYSQPADGKKRLLYEMIHYIDENCEDLHALQKLSEPFGYSYSTLASLFSQGMGETLKGYYTRQRFERAAQLLDSRHERHADIRAAGLPLDSCVQPGFQQTVW